MACKGEISMATKADEYRARAAERAKQAQQAGNRTMKDVYRDVACMWLRLAEQVDVRPELENLTDGQNRKL
jgi:hypothetical protein